MLNRAKSHRGCRKEYYWRFVSQLIVIIYLATTVIFIDFLHIPKTYSLFTDKRHTNSCLMQAGVWSGGKVDVVVQVIDPNPDDGEQFNIKANRPVLIEVRDSVQDILFETVTLKYLGDSIRVEQHYFHQDKLVLSFKNVASILEGKLPGGNQKYP